MEQTKEINKTLRMVRTHLPAPGTELGIYTFLAPDALWIGTVDAQRPFVVVAEEYVGGENGTFLLIVLSDGPVYVAELDGSMAKKPDYRDALDLQEENLIDYCAADFPKFMEIRTLSRQRGFSGSRLRRLIPLQLQTRRVCGVRWQRSLDTG